MPSKISSNVSSHTSPLAPILPSSHQAPSRARTYVDLATRLQQAGVPVDPSDCVVCDLPCPPGLTASDSVSGGRSYENYVLETYGDLNSLPQGFDTDWESELAGSAQGGRGRVVVVSTGKSDWQRDHTVWHGF